MFEIFFVILAAGLNGVAPEPANPTAMAEAPPPVSALPTPSAPQSVVIAPDSVVIGQGVIIEGTPAQTAPTAPQPAATSAFNMAVVPAGLVAEPQTPTGRFTTATEIKPILDATKRSWIAVRDYEGQDLLYITHVWSWRCGLKAVAISINNEPMQNWPMPPCYDQTATPNAILPEDGLPYLTLRQGSVQSVTIQVVYDDLSMDTAQFQRPDVLLP